MNKETTELLEKLAEKLGTTAEHLWSVLVKQAPWSGTFHIIGCCVVILFLLKALKKATNYKPVADYQDEEMIFVFKSIGVGILFLITLLAIYNACAEFPMNLAGFTNPEFWALKQILP